MKCTKCKNSYTLHLLTKYFFSFVQPNCYSKVVDILGHKHIIIFALRRIVQGEELTYDYKFPFEETKIPCSCGSKKCRKYLN